MCVTVIVMQSHYCFVFVLKAKTILRDMVINMHYVSFKPFKIAFCITLRSGEALVKKKKKKANPAKAD